MAGFARVFRLAFAVAIVTVATVAAGVAAAQALNIQIERWRPVRWLALDRLLAWDHPVVLAWAVLAVVVAGASYVYRWAPRLSLAIPPLAVLAAILAYPSAAAGSGLLARWSRPLLAVVAWLIVAKVLLLHWFAGAWRSRRTGGDGVQLLHSQQEALDDLASAIRGRPLHHRGHVIQLMGRWGDGKTVLLQAIESYVGQLEEQDREKLDAKTRAERRRRGLPSGATVVHCDVWKHQTAADLHYEIIKNLLTHEDSWYPYGWLTYPATLPVRSVAKMLQGSVAQAVVRWKSQAEVTVPIKLPALTWQSLYERVVARGRRAGRRTVLVLDEMDRATPQIAQEAITLTRRSLDVAGVTVVLGYVEPLILYKAFNPLVPTLPDLASTMDAVIYQSLVDTHEREGPDGWPTGNPLAALLASPNGNAPQSPPEAKPGDGKPADEKAASKTLEAALRAAFQTASPAHQRKLQSHFAEKYLGVAPLRIPQPTTADVAQMAMTWPGLRELTEEIVGRNRLAEAGPLFAEALAAVDVFAGLYATGHPPPPLRRLEGQLFTFLQQASTASTGDDLALACLAVCAAYDAACLQQSLSPA